MLLLLFYVHAEKSGGYEIRKLTHLAQLISLLTGHYRVSSAGKAQCFSFNILNA